MTALTQPRTASKWYNMLPTAALRQMNDFLKQWRDFNLDIIGSAREVKDYLQMFSQRGNLTAW